MRVVKIGLLGHNRSGMADATMLAALAGLLHDIGKFAVRAGERGTLEVLDPLVKSSYGQYHALLTADFVEKRVPPVWREEVKRLAGNHHRSNNPSELAIQLADHLSAGERDDPDGGADADRQRQPRQLLSIFSILKVDGLDAPGKAYWPLKPLTAEDDSAIFPVGALPTSATWPEYGALWRAFDADARALMDAHEDGGDLSTYVESMLLLMQRYTTAMPSAYYYDRPDISLYDHSRMTGALAAVMAGWPDDRLQALAEAKDLKDNTTPVALLIGGDLSGIQDFIYTITSRGAASALRGRSFYLQLLTEAALRYTLRALDLPITNVVYAGGGKFYLLARATDGESLTEAHKRVSAIIKRHHAGDIHVSLCQVALKASDFFDGRISAKWRELAEAQAGRKHQRFGELDDLLSLFDPQGTGGDALGQCAVCGNEHPRMRDDEGTRKCAQCAGYEALGKDLRHASYLSVEEVPPQPAAHDRAAWEQVLAEFGIRASVAEDVGGIANQSGLRRVVYALGDRALSDLAPLPTTAIGRRMLTNVTPILRDAEGTELRRSGVRQLPDAGSVKPFDAMEAQSEGVKRLGVLRMDVDNLGKLFANDAGSAPGTSAYGLGKLATLSRVAHLSFAIGFFFEGWVARLAQQINDEDPRGERLYSIYSGGDDLFFVGAWDAVVTLARRIRADLTRYAAGHPGIHASAGVALVGGKYPLYRSAEDADAAEQQAKRHRSVPKPNVIRAKDAISFLDEAMHWDEFERISERAERLAVWCDTGKAPKSLLQTLQQLHLQTGNDQKRAAKARRPKPDYTRATWMAAYQLSRIEKVPDDVKAEIGQIRDMLLQPNAPTREIALAARWAQLKIRQTSSPRGAAGDAD